jgi:hypothetical protein
MTRTFATRPVAAAALCATVALFATVLAADAKGDPPSPLYPDLVSDPPGHADLPPQAYNDGTGTRLLVRFDGFIHNQGPGAFELRGAGPVNLSMAAVTQRIYNSDASFVEQPTVAQIIYETNDDHQHWHFLHAARYSLWNDPRSAEVAPASKVGFCLVDGQRVEAPPSSTPVYVSATTLNCEWGNTTAPTVFMGVSAGWTDVYGYALALQWVDASDVAPGRYWLRDDVDPDGVITEVNEVNAAGWAAVRTEIPGYVAQALDLGEIPGAAKTIDLPSSTWGSPGSKQFRIVEAPAHGQLDEATNQWFSGSQVTYTPDSGYKGADSFKYEARDSTSTFPLHPAQASATLSIGDPPPPGLAISGAPSRMYTGTSVQLHASVSGGASSHVSWSTDHGSVSSSGLYTAPASPPAAGAAHITATSDSGPADTVSIGIDQAPKPKPAPIAKPAAPSRTNLLSPLRALRHGRYLMVTTTSRRAGKLAMAVRARGRRRLARCRVRMPRLTPVTCRMRLPRAYAHTSRNVRRRLNVKAVLWAGKRTVAVRRLRVR